MSIEAEAEAKAKADRRRQVGRSPAYPTLSVWKAIEKAALLYEREGEYAAPVSQATAAWGYSAKSSGARQLLATLRYYGLVDVTGDGDARKVKISETARRILLDKREDETEKRRLIRKVALTPAIHRTLYENYKAGLASDGSVTHFLTFDHAYNPSAAAELLAEFKETAAFAGLYGPSADLDKDDLGNHDSPDRTQPEIEVGDRIQWTSQGVDQFPKGGVVMGFSDDRHWVFTDQGSTGVPVRETRIMEQTPRTPPTPPQMPAHLAAALAGKQNNDGRQDVKQGQRKAVFPVEEGDVTLIFPEGLSPDGLKELGDYLDIFLRKERKKAG